MQASMSRLALLLQDKEVRVEDLRKDKIYTALQQVLGMQEVGFCLVEQEQAMHAVLNRQNLLVVVLLIGGSKSLLFTVLAVIEQTGVTIIIMLYQALINNLVERIQSSSIECIEQKHSKNNLASVVVVSVDNASNILNISNFLAYVGLLLQKGLLQQVVVDKCYLIFLAHSQQLKLALLKNLQLLSCLIVLITAMLLLV